MKKKVSIIGTVFVFAIVLLMSQATTNETNAGTKPPNCSFDDEGICCVEGSDCCCLLDDNDTEDDFMMN